MEIDAEKICHITSEVIKALLKSEQTESENILDIPVGVSNRHIHLCREDLDKLFGKGYEIQPYKELSQKGFYAAKETVTVIGPKGAINNIRLLGPLRSHTQLEMLASDQKSLGANFPCIHSGDIKSNPPISILGPKGMIVIEQGAMIALMHIHMNNADAKVLCLKDDDMVSVQIAGERGLILSSVKIRTGDFITEMHIDMDEANACNIKNGSTAKIILN